MQTPGSVGERSVAEVYKCENIVVLVLDFNIVYYLLGLSGT